MFYSPFSGFYQYLIISYLELFFDFALLAIFSVFVYKLANFKCLNDLIVVYTVFGLNLLFLFTVVLIFHRLVKFWNASLQ